ncbi:MAG: outer membrane lipoprotein-sorting protein [Termitinemataceae bacterium]|nr:MAG: outer membrane lipoprotein-sorting protein [Termitinemataceae bacterium]
MTTKKVFLFSLVLVGAAYIYAEDAQKIVDDSRNRIKADTILTQSKMVLTAKNGTTTDRVINQYSKDGANGAARTIIEFLSPASVKGTRFLTIENKNGSDDRQIYLPDLNKVRRIAASDGSSSFMGTDLSYDDISSADRDVNKDAHKLLREESLNGKACYVIESTPKDTSYQYSKVISWIDKANSVNYKMELYDKKNKLYKLYEVVELKDVQGRLSPWIIKMSNVQTGTFTTINVQKLQYDSNIPEAAFTSKYLETGKTS